jgi:hypothetical protein
MSRAGWSARGSTEIAASCCAPTARFRPTRFAREYPGEPEPVGSRKTERASTAVCADIDPLDEVRNEARRSAHDGCA